MSRSRFVVILGVLLSVLATSGCTIQYKLKAKGWGDKIKKAQEIVQGVKGAADAAGMMNVATKEFRDANLPKLDEAKNLLTELQVEIQSTSPPGSLKEAHEDLDKGVTAFIDAITAMSDAISMGDPSKQELAKQKQSEAEDAFGKAKAILTGKSG